MSFDNSIFNKILLFFLFTIINILYTKFYFIDNINYYITFNILNQNLTFYFELIDMIKGINIYEPNIYNEKKLNLNFYFSQYQILVILSFFFEDKTQIIILYIIFKNFLIYLFCFFVLNNFFKNNLKKFLISTLFVCLPFNIFTEKYNLFLLSF